jgi:hypothetical protein
MDVFEIAEKLRAEYPAMSAGALISIGLGAGWATAWLLQRQQIATYKAKLEHLQEVIHHTSKSYNWQSENHPLQLT